MLYYDISPEVEAFSTNTDDTLDFPVLLPLHQAHSALVRRVPEEEDRITGVDALITDRPGLRIGVKTADCVPILLHDPCRKAVAAVHSGWRGTVQNILAATIGRMGEEFGTAPADIRAVIGPCIHQDAFEVGDEVYEQFKDTPGVCRLISGRWHIDLPECCRRQMLRCGVLGGNIEVRPECTWRQHERFFSARRLGKAFGRQRIYNCIMIVP